MIEKELVEVYSTPGIYCLEEQQKMNYTSYYSLDGISPATRKISFFEYLFIFTLIIYTGHANKYVVSTSILDNPIWYGLIIIMGGILAIRWRIVLNKQFYLLIFAYLIYFVAISIKFHEFRPSYFLNNAFLFFITYATVKALRVNFFRIYEVTMVYLAMIGLVIWVVQIVLGGDNLFNYFNKIPSIEEFSNVSGNGLNAILYSVQPTTMSLQFDFLPPRNCGFAWEPGGFAVMLALAIFINLFFYDFIWSRQHALLDFIVSINIIPVYHRVHNTSCHSCFLFLQQTEKTDSCVMAAGPCFNYSCLFTSLYE